MTGPEGRLVIDRLELCNFKSYSDRHVIGPFHKSFTSVIGPNGSGKSNVIDSLLFVFGKRAKKLRMNKLSEMIHKSAQHSNNTFAKVTVHFHQITDEEDSGGVNVVNGSAFSVSRIVHINSKSEYQLNDATVPFGEIASLLKSKGIDLDNNRFLILQGEVELISQMKPIGSNVNDVGLLEYLEEIIGSDGHKETIELLANRVEEAISEKESMQRRIRNVEEETARLEQNKGEAENYLRKKAYCLQLRSKHKSRTRLLIQRRAVEMQKEIQELQDQIDQTTPALAELKREVEQGQAEGGQFDAKCQHLRKELEKAEKRVSDGECLEVRLRAQSRQIDSEKERIASKLNAVREELASASEAVDSAETESRKLQSAISAMSNNLNSEEQKLEQFRKHYSSELNALNTELTDVRLAAAPYRQRMVQIEGKTKVKRAEHQLLSQKVQEPQTEMLTLKAKLEEITTLHSDHVVDLSKEKSDTDQLRSAHNEAETELQRIKTQMEKLEDKVDQAETQLNESKRNTAALMHQSKKMKLLIEAKASSRIPGIHGRLGDLGFIGAQYDIAVSSCCAALDYIVVETVEDAEAAGQLLRDNQLSPLTFLILNKQTQLEQRMRAPMHVPHGSARLFDLVRVQEERLRVAFYFGFRDMLVTDTLDDATRIAFGDRQRRYNIVTLKGEVLSEVGAMTGGGAPQKGRMRLGEAPLHPMQPQAEAAQREEASAAHLRRVQQELQTVQLRYQQVTERDSQLQNAIETRSTEIRKKEITIEQEKREIVTLQKELRTKQTQTQVGPEDAMKLKEVEMEIADLENAWNEIQKESAQLLEHVQNIEAQIENIGNGAIKKQTEHIQMLKDEIRSSGERVAQLQWTVTSAPRKEQDLKQNEQDLTAKLQESEERRKEKNTQIENIQNQLAELTDHRQQIQTMLTTEQDSLKEFRQKMVDKQQEAIRLQEKEEQAKAQLDNTESAYEDGVRQISDIDKDICRYKEQFVECVPDEEFPEFVEHELEQLDVRLIEHQIQALSTELEAMDVNLTSVYKYRDKKKELDQKKHDFDILMAKKNAIVQEYESVKEKRLTEFLAGFNLIKTQLKRVYRSITNGGDADLELVDSFDPFSEGIEFSVRPPHKSWKKIANLSGGEKTLSSLSLIFALHYFRPTPIYVMDEIDAALDVRNVTITANYIANKTKNAQFIVISLRSQMFDRATELVGIYKLQDCSESVIIYPENCLPATQRRSIVSTVRSERHTVAISAEEMETEEMEIQ